MAKDPKMALHKKTKVLGSRLQMLTLKEVAKFLSLSEKTVYRLVKAGILPALKIGGQWRFEQQVLDAWLSNQLNESLFERESKAS
jgi:excisionase family DNA binding protein